VFMEFRREDRSFQVLKLGLCLRAGHPSAAISRCFAFQR
jgi:hypothetical protein